MLLRNTLMRLLLSWIWCFLISASGLSAAEYYVSPDGSDSNSGDKATPLRTIQAAVDRLKPGDTCIIREGVYREAVKLENMWATAAAPVVIKAYAGESVSIDGSDPVNVDWVQHEGQIYKAQIERDTWQLFVGDTMMMPARWPNASIQDGSVWQQDTHWAHGDKASGFGEMVTRTEAGRPDLSATGIDFTGAMAVMNIGKWQTHSRRVMSHQAGSNAFRYKADNPVLDDPTFWDDGYWEQTQRYYLECHLDCLDSEGEWFYDPKTSMLYLWAPGGGRPQKVRAQHRTYGIQAHGLNHVVVQGLDFFACTIDFQNARNSTIMDCDFLYFEHSKRMLGEEDAGQHNDFTCATRLHGPISGSYNAVINCTFSYCDGGALWVEGNYDRIENVLAHDLDWSGVGYHTWHLQGAENALVRRVSIHRAGASEVLSAGRANTVELCDIGPDVGMLQQDGAAIQFRPHLHLGSIVRYCWTHDHTKFGIRADIAGHMIEKGADPAESEGLGCLVHHNVVWGIDQRESTKPAIHIEGDHHMIYHNLSFDNQVRDICLPAHGGWANKHTVTRNNVTDVNGIGTQRLPAEDHIPGIADHNWGGGVAAQLRQPQQRDFRPKHGAEIAEKAYVVMGVTEDWWLRKRDLGPYQYDALDYWIPGFQTANASRPIPSDGAGQVQANSDLIWLHAWQSERAHVYFGESHDAVSQADAQSPLLLGNVQHNVLAPQRSLQPGKTYFWRVDAVDVAGVASKGAVWRFTVAP